MKKRMEKRTWAQILALVFFNGYAAGYAKGSIFQGKTKMVCVPVLHCYSCPGALGACPIGSLQSVLSSGNHRFSFYCLGLLALFGLFLGRLVCGFLCPFGFLQDLLHLVPLKKIRVPEKADRILKGLKYLVLLFLVFLLPMLVVDEYGLQETWFCTYLCPAGTLGAGLPLLVTNDSLRSSVSWLFGWKTCILLILLLLSTMVHRPFCRYLCPLGAFYGLFSKFSLYQMQLDKNKCTGCGACEQACPMQVKCRKEINSPDCIRCGKCKAVCPEKAISSSYGFKK